MGAPGIEHARKSVPFDRRGRRRGRQAVARIARIASLSGADAGERDRSVDLPVVGQRVDVVVGRDPLRVAQELGDVGERPSALVVQRASP